MPGSSFAREATLANPTNSTLRDIDLALDIPRERIAQRPPDERGGSKLLVYERRSGAIRHHAFTDIPGLLPGGCLLVLNDTRVVPSRIIAKKPTGGKIDVLLLRWLVKSGVEGLAEVLVRGSGRGPRTGTVFRDERIEGELLERTPRGSCVARLRARGGEHVEKAFASSAVMPLPPYIRRTPDADDLERYQTVYGERDGSVAAPTAGLHFTPGIIDAAKAAGAEIALITLHVGEGTFAPIRCTDLADHRMHEEEYSIGEEAAELIGAALAGGRRVIPVGTSCVRALEGVYLDAGRIEARSGSTSLFIAPGFEFEVIGGMVTNFHTPRSTPLAMVAALAGIEALRRAYRAALEEGYRFFSYGDAMLIL